MTDSSKHSHVLMNVREKILHVNNGIYYYLTRAMIGDVTAAVDRIKACLNRRKIISFYEEIFFITAFAQRKDMWMFTKNKIISGGSVFCFREAAVSRFDCKGLRKQAGLIVESLLIIDQAKVDNLCFMILNMIHWVKVKICQVNRTNNFFTCAGSN